MSVRPVTFNEDGSIEVHHDEFNHSGTIPPDQIIWRNAMDGNPNHYIIVLDCPAGCDSQSFWPVGGGADAINGQRMFVEKITRDGCACGNVEAGNDVLADAHAHLNCARIDGEERWQV